MVKKLHSHTSQMLLNSTIDHEQVEAGAGDHPEALASHGEINLIQIFIHSTNTEPLRGTEN